jgi:hypothetical protein
MSVWGCGSPAHCSQPAVAGGFIDCRSQEWASHSPSPPGFVYLESSWAQPPLLQAFPFPSALGEVALHLHSRAGVFIYSSRGKWAFLTLLWSFPPTTTFISFPAPAFSGWLVYLQFHEGLPLFPLFSTQDTPPSLLRVLFFQLLVYYSVWFFPWVRVSLSRGLCWCGPGCLWEYRVPLTSPGGLLLQSMLGTGVWWCGNPPGFSV